MAKKTDITIAPIDLKGVVHDCKDGKHRALLIRSNGDIYETMPASSKEVQSFADEMSEKFGIREFIADGCRSDPELAAMMGKDSRKSTDVVRELAGNPGGRSSPGK